jgi:hypothetical protein
MRRPVAVFKRLWKWLSKGDRRNTKELISSKSSRVGLQAAVIRATAGEDQGIAVRRIGWFETTSYTELDTAQRFCRLSYNALTNLEKVSQYNDVDILAKSADGSRSEEFQVTRLWDGTFWQQLNTTGAYDGQLSRDDLRNLARDAVRRKQCRYTYERRRKLILLIDTNPVAVLPHFNSIKADLKTKLDRIGFKQVWLVGPEQTFEMSSSRE